MLKPAARNGKLCFGPSRGQTVTFVSPQRWLGEWRTVDPETALIDMARRFIHAYGPANKGDFAYWWGNWTGVGAAAWAGLHEDLAEVEVEGWRAHILRSDLKQIASVKRPHNRVQLLPNFDPYLMGHARRDHLFDRVHSSKVSRTAGWISPVILVDGRVEGVWAYALNSKRRMTVTLTPFARLAKGVIAEARARAESIAKAMGATLDRVTVAS
jgi:hypothetical protein